MNTQAQTAATGIVMRLLISALLVALATACWMISRWERRLAHFDEALATLQYDAPPRELPELEASMKYAPSLPWFTRLLASGRETRAVAEYWQLSEPGGTQDTQNALVSANARFRASQGGRDRTAIMRELDTVLKLYADVLRTTPDVPDAAYNYEYVARLRTVLTKTKDIAGAVRAPKRSIHGREGTLPEDADMKRFKMFVPMQPDERKDVQPDAGKGEKKVRKG